MKDVRSKSEVPRNKQWKLYGEKRGDHKYGRGQSRRICHRGKYIYEFWMLRSLNEEPSATMLQSYNEGYTDHLNYGQHLQMAPHYHHQPWYNNYIHHQEGENGSSDYLGRGDGKETPDWRGYREIGESDPTAYIPPQPSQDGGYPTQEVGPLMGQMQMDSPLMGQVLQDPLMLPSEQHTSPLITNGIERLEPPQPTHKQEEEELQGKSESQPAQNKKDVLKLPGFHQTFGNITEIGRFSQPDEFFESRPPEIPDPPAKVSESLEVKRKPRGRKRKQPEPRELYPRSEQPEPVQWPPPPAAPHWEPPQHHHWHRPHPYYSHQYHHPHQYQQYYHQPPHLDCPPPPPPPPPYHYYQPTPWHPAARDYLHHHPYQGFV